MTLGALMIITMISVSQQRSNFLLIEKAYVREQQNAALDYAAMRLEHITSSLAYDESMVDGDDADVNLMTAKAALGPDAGELAPADFDDIDDYNGYTESVNHVLSADTFRFAVTYSVRYVNPTNPEQDTATPTFVKELAMDVVSRDTIGYRVAKYNGTKLSIATND